MSSLDPDVYDQRCDERCEQNGTRNHYRDHVTWDNSCKQQQADLSAQKTLR